MENTELTALLRNQTDLVVQQLEWYKRGYLDALTFLAAKLAEQPKPVVTPAPVVNETPSQPAN